MTKAKKVLSLVLAVVMVAATFAFSASAVTQNATFTVSVDNATVSQGDVINVTVNLTTDYYAGPTNVPVYYNPAVFEFVAGSVTGAKIFGEGATDVQSYNDAVTGCLKVAFIPNTAGTAAAKLLNGTLFTFQLKAIADGSSNIGLKAEDQKTSTNIGGTLYCGAYTSSAIDSNPATVGQTFAITNTSATVGATATPELQLSATGAANGAVIDRVSTCATGNGFVYGINTDTGESIADYLTTPAGSIRVTENASGVMSTGATIELLAADGSTVLETYYFVFFGDVNGDGFVDGIDVSAVDGVASFMDFSFMADDGSVEAMASDVNGDLFIDGIDVSDIDGVASFMSFPTQADYAATLASAKGIA